MYRSATTMAFVPSGVKYRLYGSVMGMLRVGRPVLGSISVRVLPSVLLK
jgi:hypothetical protein